LETQQCSVQTPEVVTTFMLGLKPFDLTKWVRPSPQHKGALYGAKACCDVEIARNT
jgi:hypothetical protein